MVDSPGTSGYPPPRNTWEFPPRPVSRGKAMLGAAAGVLALLVAGGLGAALVVADRGDDADHIDDGRLVATIAAQCELMTSTVSSMPLSGGTTDQARTILDQNRAVEIMVRAIRAGNDTRISDDPPAGRWLRDWELLVAARATYARELRNDPRASLVVPVDGDGNEITRRMDGVWRGDPTCEVPETLTLPLTDSSAGA